MKRLSPPNLPRQAACVSRPASFMPVQLFDVEIGQPLPGIAPSVASDGSQYGRGRALIRLHGHPLGRVDFDFDKGSFTPGQFAQMVWDALSGCIEAHLQDDGVRSVPALSPDGIAGPESPPCRVSPTQYPPVSVIVATRDRPEAVDTCLRSLIALDYPAYEIIVVDNAPQNSRTAEVVRGIASESPSMPSVRYVLHAQPGVSHARNRGMAEARGEIIAFVDDDVVVDRHWLEGIVRGFEADSQATCVTGLVLPAEMETPAQVWFEQYGGFSRGYRRNIFDLKSHTGVTPLYPFNAGAFGAGASMAFRAEELRNLGGFDKTLGPGTPAKGGEDLDLFLRVILAGHRLVYEPSAVAWHFHRRESAELRRHIQGYGVGLAAVLTKFLFDPSTAWDVLRRVPRGATFLLSPSSPKNAMKATGFPRLLTWLELAGILQGPLAYLKSRRRSGAPGVGSPVLT